MDASEQQERLYGVIPPMITPFQEDGEVDVAALKEVVGFLVGHVNGLFICGSYGSGPLMTPEQRRLVVKTVVETVGGRIPVIAQVGSPDTATAAGAARDAVHAGAQRVAALPPYYFGHSEDRVLRYFEAVVKAVDVPVYVYNNPGTTGFSVTPAFLSRLAEVGVRGVKDSSFDIITFTEYLERAPEGFDVVLGTEAMFLSAHALGAQAFIPGLANCLPEPVRELFDLCVAGNLAEARKAQMRVLRLRRAVQKAGPTLVGVQEVLKMRGINAGLPREPFAPLSQERRAGLRDALAAEGIRF